MREHDLPPYAPSLIESMRSIGYSFDSALADVIDNSIAASAKHISIQFRSNDKPYIAIIDDGNGMSPDDLISAMRHGHRNPLEARGTNDLGRYGLGLKTASLSQCRKLTVITLKNKQLSACCWDIDYIIKKEKWSLLVLEKNEIVNMPHVEELKANGQGTIVLWQGLDKLTVGESSMELALGQKLDHARDHLALIFHRYIAGELGIKTISMTINNLPLKAIDPFLKTHKATQILDEDTFSVEGQKIIVKPYILPHLSKLKIDEAKLAGGKDGLRSQQGFYVYRNCRLIIWGTWFKITGKDELSKLARVRVDIPNSLDHLWTLDIKKSAAHPPEIVRNNLRRIIEKIRDASGRTLVFPGQKQRKGPVALGWNEVLDRDGFRYEINKDHPFLASLKNHISPPDFKLIEELLKIIENTLPVDSIYSRLASDQKHIVNVDEGHLRNLLKTVILNLNIEDKRSILNRIQSIEPFNKHPEIVSKLIKELS